jgi:Leucine-rich repeat (LRR) protein
MSKLPLISTLGSGLINRDENAISYLTGIPCGVRTLYATGNRLTALASVDHLRNLQFLDVSRNQLDSVART